MDLRGEKYIIRSIPAGLILNQAIAYEKSVTLYEPRYKATAWHAHDTCRCCGSCILHGKKSSTCPGVFDPDAI